MKERCACGRPLHYTNPDTERLIRGFVEQLGPTVIIKAMGHAWKVPRHFIALHGLRASELFDLAERYHFEEVSCE
jgi:hypothetical protein